jgi:hypothetical protein
VAPAYEHLDTGEGIGLQVDSWLVHQEELTGVERARELSF